MKKALSLLLVLIMVLMMTACGAKKEEAPAATASNVNIADNAEAAKQNMSTLPQTPAADAKPAAEEKKEDDSARYGGTLVLATKNEPIQPMFMYYSSTTEGLLNDFIFDRLFAYADDLKLVPRLATGATTEDNKTWTISLRDDVVWQDGEPFTADDIVFFTEFYNTLDTTLKGDAFNYEVTAVDPHTVKIVLDEPNMMFLYSEFIEYCTTCPKHIWSKVDVSQYDSLTDISLIVGTGPFKLTKLSISEEVVMERNEKYWDGRPYLDSVVLRIIPDNDARDLAFENKEIQMVKLSSEKVMNRIVPNNPGFACNMYPSGNMQLLMLNNADPITGQLSVRKALNYLCNREALKVAAGANSGDIMTVPFTPADIGYNAAATNGEMGVYDPAKAVAVLEADGWKKGSDGIYEKDGKKLQVELLATACDPPQYQILVEECKAIGFDLKIRVVDTTTRNAEVFTKKPYAERNFQMFWNGMTLGPSAFGYQDQYGGENNYLTYSNPTIAELFSKAKACKTVEEAQTYFDEIQTTMDNDCPAVWLWSAKRGWATNSYLNLSECGMNGFYKGWVNFGKAYFEKQ